MIVGKLLGIHERPNQVLQRIALRLQRIHRFATGVRQRALQILLRLSNLLRRRRTRECRKIEAPDLLCIRPARRRNPRRRGAGATSEGPAAGERLLVKPGHITLVSRPN